MSLRANSRGEPQSAEFVRSAMMNGAGSALILADAPRNCRLQTLIKETFDAERLTDPSPAMLAQAAADAARAPEQSV